MNARELKLLEETEIDPFEYNPITDLFDKYANNRFEGDIEERSFLVALVAVQSEMLKKYAWHEEKVKWLFKMLGNKNLMPNLEMEYDKQRTKKIRSMN